eukprot:747979-Hanusia_phi.AAC.7
MVMPSQLFWADHYLDTVFPAYIIFLLSLFLPAADPCRNPAPAPAHEASGTCRCSAGRKCAMAAMVVFDLLACSMSGKGGEGEGRRCPEACFVPTPVRAPVEENVGCVWFHPGLQSLRGGEGQRKLLRLRQQRRQDQMRQEMELRGLSEIDGAMLKRKMTKRQQEQLKQEPPTWEEYRDKILENEWKTAERRLKMLKRDEESRAFTAHQKDDRNEAELDEEFRDLPPMRQVNDGKGNIDFVGLNLCPPNITDPTEILVWIEDHYQPFDRYITMEDIVADQKATATVTAKEKLQTCYKELVKDLNISIPESIDGGKMALNVSKNELNGRVEAMLNSQDVDALCTYGIALHSWMKDLDGAEVRVCPLWGLRPDPRLRPVHVQTCSAREPEACVDPLQLCQASERRAWRSQQGSRAAPQGCRDNPWLRLVLKEEKWKSYANVRVDRRLDFSQRTRTDEGVGVQLAQDI